MLRLLVALCMCLPIGCALAQQLNVNYRTTVDSTERLHYLTFTDGANCKLDFPATNHGEQMVPQQRSFMLTYRMRKDTIVFYGADPNTQNKAALRLLQGRFVVVGKRKIFDVNSGYTYVDSRLVSNKYDIYAVDGKIYKQRRTKVDGYGEVRKSYRPNRKLSRRIGEKNTDQYSLNILRGKAAFDKYGVVGMNGVIEILTKN